MLLRSASFCSSRPTIRCRASRLCADAGASAREKGYAINPLEPATAQVDQKSPSLGFDQRWIEMHERDRKGSEPQAREQERHAVFRVAGTVPARPPHAGQRVQTRGDRKPDGNEISPHHAGEKPCLVSQLPCQVPLDAAGMILHHGKPYRLRRLHQEGGEDQHSGNSRTQPEPEPQPPAPGPGTGEQKQQEDNRQQDPGRNPRARAKAHQRPRNCRSLERRV